jgi:protein SCO1/2
MNAKKRRLILALLAMAGLPALAGPPVLPSERSASQLDGVGIDEHLGRPVDLTLTFSDENGNQVVLGDFFHQGRPVILNLIYYSCPSLCDLILNGQTVTLREIPWTPGNEFEVVTISIDPRETADLARQKKASYLHQYGRPAPGWHFLTDRDGNAKRLAEQVGYHYRWDPRQQQFAHAAGIMVLTPEGKMARYLYGIRFGPRDLRFALAEASENRPTMSVEKILLYCFHYDPQAGGYVLFATNFMRAGGALTVLVVAFFLWRLIRAERRKSGRWNEGMA